jgi:hypothetical protein
MISSRRLRSLGIDVEEYRREVRIDRTRELMKYGSEQFKEDWSTAIALAQLMALHGPLGCQESQLESCMMRINAYVQNNPEDRPW